MLVLASLGHFFSSSQLLSFSVMIAMEEEDPHHTATAADASRDKTRNLSIAVELKFLVPFLQNSGPRPAVQSCPPIETCGFIESAKGVKADDNLRLWRHAFSNIAEAVRSVPKQYAYTSFDLEDLRLEEKCCWGTHWVVKKSNSAEPVRDDARRDDVLWVPTEVNSPKMAWSDPDTFATITAVMKAIERRYHIVSNYMCEVHVHVGRMDGQSLSTVTLKRLAMLLWVVEPVLRGVKDPASPNFRHVYTWSSAAREHSRLAT